MARTRPLSTLRKPCAFAEMYAVSATTSTMMPVLREASLPAACRSDGRVPPSTPTPTGGATVATSSPAVSRLCIVGALHGSLDPFLGDRADGLVEHEPPQPEGRDPVGHSEHVVDVVGNDDRGQSL